MLSAELSKAVPSDHAYAYEDDILILDASGEQIAVVMGESVITSMLVKGAVSYCSLCDEVIALCT